MPRPRRSVPLVQHTLKFEPDLFALVCESRENGESFNAAVQRLLMKALTVRKAAIVVPEVDDVAALPSPQKDEWIAQKTRALSYSLPHSIARREAEKAWNER